MSALVASFSMLYCPENVALARAYEARFPFFGPESHGFAMENQGHGEGDPIGTFTIYTWGNGSALATAATVRNRFGDVYVDPRRGHAFGVDGVVAEMRGGRVLVEDRYGRARVLAVRADGGRRMISLSAGADGSMSLGRRWSASGHPESRGARRAESRRLSLTVLMPMGGEMAYRYPRRLDPGRTGP